MLDSISMQPEEVDLSSSAIGNTPTPLSDYEQQKFAITRHFDFRNSEHAGVRRMLLIMSGLEL